MTQFALLWISLTMSAAGKGEACKKDADCVAQRPHLICARTCEIGCRVDADCLDGSYCRAMPFKEHMQCARVDPRSTKVP